MSEKFEYTREWTNAKAFPLLGFTKSWENPEDYPTIELDETQVRRDMQSLHDEVKNYINDKLIPAVLAEDATEEARAAAEETRVANEKKRIEAETAREEKETGYVARAEQAAARADEAVKSLQDVCSACRGTLENTGAEQVSRVSGEGDTQVSRVSGEGETQTANAKAQADAAALYAASAQEAKAALEQSIVANPGSTVIDATLSVAGAAAEAAAVGQLKEDVTQQKEYGYLLRNYWSNGDVTVTGSKRYDVALKANTYYVSGICTRDDDSGLQAKIRIYYSDNTVVEEYFDANTGFSFPVYDNGKDIKYFLLFSADSIANSEGKTAVYSRLVITDQKIEPNDVLLERFKSAHMIPIPFRLEHGSVNANGSLGSHSTRCRSGLIPVAGDVEVSLRSDNGKYLYQTAKYKADGTFEIDTAKAFSRPTVLANDVYGGGAFRMQFRNADESDVSDADMDYIASQLVVRCSDRARHQTVVTPELFGAVGDGIHDDTAAMQKALNVGGVVSLEPLKTYRITSMLEIKTSNTIFDGNGATIVSEVPSGCILLASGSVSAESRLAKNVISKDGYESFVDLSYEATPGLKRGDTLIVQSQRDALAMDSGLFWCGTPTANTQTSHWAEPLTINRVGSNTHSVCTGTLIYPYYFADREKGVDVSTQTPIREHSTIRKANFLDGVVIRDVKILAYGGSAHIDNTIVMNWCKNSRIEQVEVKKCGDASHGRCFVFQNCWNCKFINCVADASLIYHESYEPTHVFDNHFTFSSCWQCSAVGCASYHAGQTFDTTYANVFSAEDNEHVRCPSVGILVEGCAVHGSTDNAATSHSGAWGITFRNCTFHNCGRGMTIRSPHTTIDGCTFMCNATDGNTPTECAIALTEPTIFQCKIINNTIIGSAGINITPSVSRLTQAPGDLLSVLGIVVSGNSLQHTYGGIVINRYSAWEQTSDMGIVICNNVFRDAYRVAPVVLYKGCNGVSILNNIMIGCEAGESYDSLINVRGGDVTNLQTSGNTAILCNRPITV